MKKLLFIMLLVFPFIVFGQQMSAVKKTITVNNKFKVISYHINVAKDEAKKMIARELTSSQKVLRRKETNSLLLELNNVLAKYKPLMIDTTIVAIQVDSLQTVERKAFLTSEINRLKEELLLGSDSAIIQPKIKDLTTQRSEINKIMQTWVRVN